MLGAGFVALVVVANLGCAPKYFQRGDVIGMLAIAAYMTALLGYAALGDTDVHRAVGAVSSAGIAALFLSTASIPLLVAPLGVIGAFRLPRSRRPRWLVILGIPVVVMGALVVPYIGQAGMSPDQFRCP